MDETNEKKEIEAPPLPQETLKHVLPPKRYKLKILLLFSDFIIIFIYIYYLMLRSIIKDASEGSFSFVVDESETQLKIRPIRPGKATVQAGNEIRQFATGRCRIVANPDRPGEMQIQGPLPPEQNVIVNGDFAAMLDRGWEEPEKQR